MMKDIRILGGMGCRVIKYMINVDQCIQYDIDYGEKKTRTYMDRPCVISINSV